MDFNIKEKKYKKTKYNLQKIITGDNIFLGSGGRSNVVIIHNDIVLKIIPEFKKKSNMKKKPNNDQTEIKFYKFFTKEFLKTNITPHIVGIYDNYKSLDIKSIFPGKCLNKSELLLAKP